MRNEPVLILGLTGMAVVQRSQGRDDAATEAAGEALDLYRAGHSRRFRNRVDAKRDLPIAAAACSVVLAAIAAERDEPEHAAELLGRAERLRATRAPRFRAFSRPTSTGPDSRRSQRSVLSGSRNSSTRPGRPTRPRRAPESGRSAPARRLFSALLESAVIPQHCGPDLQEDS